MMIGLEECKIEPLDDETCQGVLAWVAGGPDPTRDSAFNWLLAHCYDGVTWGRLDDNGRFWRLSSTFFPDRCPPISASNLLEIRLFGPEMETLIWRKKTGFSGRRLIDALEEDDGSPIRPDDENRVLLGDRLVDGPKGGFACVGTADGKMQALPIPCAEADFGGKRSPLRLKVRHYFEQDEQTGAVRVAASRLVDIFKEV